MNHFEELPLLLQQSPKLNLWTTPDPGGKGEVILRQTIGKIQGNVEKFVNQIDQNF